MVGESYNSSKGKTEYTICVCAEAVSPESYFCLFLPPNMQNKLTSNKNRIMLLLLKGKDYLRKDSNIFLSF